MYAAQRDLSLLADAPPAIDPPTHLLIYISIYLPTYISAYPPIYISLSLSSREAAQRQLPLLAASRWCAPDIDPPTHLGRSGPNLKPGMLCVCGMSGLRKGMITN